MRIDVTLVDRVPVEVNTPDDLERARRLISGNGRPLILSRHPRSPSDLAPHGRPKTEIADGGLSAKPKRATALERKTLLRVSYQGEPGANSHLACRDVFPDLEPVACATFEDALAAVKGGDARYAMIPIENSVAGRVADIHHLLPNAEPAHRRRALPARAPPADGAAGRVAADRQAGAVAHPGARPMPQHAAQAGPQGRSPRPTRPARRASSPRPTTPSWRPSPPRWPPRSTASRS